MNPSIEIPSDLLEAIHAHGEDAYPEEGAGFLLGVDGASGTPRRVQAILPLPNSRERDARHNRYLITPKEYLHAEMEAGRRGMDLIGVFHSHPDHPDRPSEYDREWAQPFFSYLITRVDGGNAIASRSWRLLDDRSRFVEESLHVGPPLTMKTT